MRVTGNAADRPAASAGGGGSGAAPSSTLGFETFARREHRPLVGFAWALTGDRAAAEDLAQEALAAAWHRWAVVGGYDRPGAWARRVVANRAIDRRRKAGREQRALRRLGGNAHPAVVELEPDDDRFWAEVRRLPERQAQAVALHYLEDRGVAEIAEILGCAEATVRVHLHRGRLALGRVLGAPDAPARPDATDPTTDREEL
jgi:RNA polymerase sigma-70 factor (ECF subfamily)